MKLLWFFRCPHHQHHCPGRSCCCSDRHFRPLKALRETDGYAWTTGGR